METENPVNIGIVKLGQKRIKLIKCGIKIEEAFDIILNNPIDKKDVYVIEEIKTLT